MSLVLFAFGVWATWSVASSERDTGVFFLGALVTALACAAVDS